MCQSDSGMTSLIDTEIGTSIHKQTLIRSGDERTQDTVEWNIVWFLCSWLQSQDTIC